MTQTLGIDFGTSNTAAAVLVGGRPHLIEVEPGRTSLPTSVFFDYDRKVTTYGSVANTALIDGREGRFMRALKSVLGTPLMREKRQIAYEQLTLIEVVARFLQTIRERAEATTGASFKTALSGRPVRFHSTDDLRNAQAEIDLRDAYLLAGYDHVSFMFEPEAAALAAGPLPEGKLGLIIDIGGGTSDFSVFERSSDNTRIIVSHGVRVGGTDFDKAISLAQVMPLLGYGAEIKNEMGPGTHTAPKAIFNDLASWEKIPFLYTGEMRRLAARFHKLGVQPELFGRLSDVLEMELGHDIAFAVEAGKIRVNAPDAQDAAIDLRVIEKQLWARMSAAQLSAILATHAETIRVAALKTLEMADLTPDQIGQIVFVGGSSLMGVVESAMVELFPSAILERTEAFTAVADGLAIAASKGLGKA
ncbi:MAG: Hsp70 family protein [Yoonia sp.]|nr:Hsp70 family protein [Yoonia sp.]